MTQIGERPPRFSIQVNDRDRVTRDYAYFLENRLRERYRLEGVPLVIDFVERNERGARPGSPKGAGSAPPPTRPPSLTPLVSRPRKRHRVPSQSNDCTD